MSLATDAERLRAGLDEDERRAKKALTPGIYRWVDIHDDLERLFALAEGDFAEALPKRMLREAAAKRAILALYEEFAAEQDRQLADPACKFVGPGIRTGTEVLGQVVAALAGVYADAEAR